LTALPPRRDGAQDQRRCTAGESFDKVTSIHWRYFVFVFIYYVVAVTASAVLFQVMDCRKLKRARPASQKN
jgi:hypothetical protein